MNKLRFILKQDEIEIGRYQTIKDVAKIIGCGYQHIYKNENGFFKYKKVEYQIIDRLEELN
jgi:hypothetical protein